MIRASSPAEVWDGIYKKKGYIWLTPNKTVVKFASLFKKPENKDILDLGCGSGRHSIYLAKKGFFVAGIDISEMAVKLAEHWMKRENLRNTVVLNLDMVKIPFPEQYFDGVISTNVIYHNPPKLIKKTVENIYKVLCNGGYVLVTVPSTDNYKYGLGEKIDKHSFVMNAGTDAGIVHTFFDKQDLEKLFDKFKIISLKKVKQKETVGGGNYWSLIAQKI